MESVIFTQRLKLTLVTTAERGSKEVEWVHELRSNEQTTWWSSHGRSKSLEDTEKFLEAILALPATQIKGNTYRVVYTVHELLPSTDSNSETTKLEDFQSRMIGLVTIRSLDSGNNLNLPPHLFPESTRSSPNVLTVALGYQYLPIAWGKGYATESVNAVFNACKRARAFWTPFEKAHVRGIVNAENVASQHVVAKVGMPLLGVHEWKGDAIYLAGQWRQKLYLCIYGMFLVE